MFVAESLTWEFFIIAMSLSIFSLMTILTKSYKHKTDLLLCSWLVLLNLPLIHTALSHLNYFSHTFHTYTNPTLNLLHGPLLYLYVRMLISKKAFKATTELWHLIPFTIFYPLFISMSHPAPMTPLPNRENNELGPIGENAVVIFFEPLLFNFGLISGLFFVGYSLVTIYTLIKHQQNIKGVFSQNDNQLSLKWIYALPATFVILVVINIVNENVFEATTQAQSLALHMLSFMCFIIVLCFFGVKQKPVFYFKLSALNSTENINAQEQSNNQEVLDDSENTRTHTPDISDAAISTIIEDMQNHMRLKQPYLDPDFCVYSLAQALNIPRRVLSQVLNKGLSKNFYLYVNEFRIEEVKKQLTKQEKTQSTILDIAFQSGFKSKSSFNSLFKQSCDVTPSQYRKMAKQNS